MVKVTINYDLCDSIGECMDNCPSGVFDKEGDKIVVVNEDACTACRVCEQVCPKGAVKVDE